MTEEEEIGIIAQAKKARLASTGRMQITLDEDVANELRRLRREGGIIIRTSVSKMLRESLKL